MRALLIACALVAGCSTSSGGHGSRNQAVSGSMTIGADEGIDFSTAKKVKPFSFSTCDLYATSSGAGSFKLTTGGPTPTQFEPVRWFVKGGFATVYQSLEDVPSEKPGPDETASRPNVEAGLGFVVKNHLSEGYTKGWVREATAGGVTIEFEPLE